MQLTRISLHELALPLLEPFRTSFGTVRTRRVVLVAVQDEDGRLGYGESPPISPPVYTEESVGTAWHVLSEYLCPLALTKAWPSPHDLAEAMRVVKRNFAAKCGLENAVWDLDAKRREVSVAQLLGGTRAAISSGIAIGIIRDAALLVETVEVALNQGYRRIKVKIMPGWDLDPVRILRERLGEFPLAVDANAAYTRQDADRLLQLDEFALEMMEQPFAWDELEDHAELQRRLSTRICLDESISSLRDVERALNLGSCRSVNIKPGRVGGLTESLRIHEFCHKQSVPVWCGGLLETGVGRAHSVALASLPGFTEPADLSPSKRYYAEDIVSPEFDFASPGEIAVPTAPGIGVELNRELLQHYTVQQVEILPPR